MSPWKKLALEAMFTQKGPTAKPKKDKDPLLQLLKAMDNLEMYQEIKHKKQKEKEGKKEEKKFLDHFTRIEVMIMLIVFAPLIVMLEAVMVQRAGQFLASIFK